MILSEKIVAIRKKYGWSQEELAEKLEVSRQSVSKWEIGAAIPDLDKIVKLSSVTGISTDYLLKDDADDNAVFGKELNPVVVPSAEEESDGTVSLDQANAFLDLSRKVAKRIALGLVLIVLSPLVLMLSEGIGQLSVFDKDSEPLTAPEVPETPEIPEIEEDDGAEVNPNTIAYYKTDFSVKNLDGSDFNYKALLPAKRIQGVGELCFLLCVAGGFVLIVLNMKQLSKYKTMNSEIFSLSYGVEGIVSKRKKEFESSFNVMLTLGIVLCGIPILPALLEYLSIINRMSQMVISFYACASLVLIASGLYLIASNCIIKNSYSQILQTGNYTPDRKVAGKAGSNKLGFFWMVVAFVYIAISYFFKSLDKTWLIWPIAAGLFVCMNKMFGTVEKKKQ